MGKLLEYCSSSAYIVSPSAIKKILNKETKSITNEEKWRTKGQSKEKSQLISNKRDSDKWMSEHLTDLSGIPSVYLNLRYGYDEISIERWLKSPLPSPLP